MGCYGLSNLPPCLTRMGLCDNGSTRIVSLKGTSFSEEFIDALRKNTSPGMEFKF